MIITQKEKQTYSRDKYFDSKFIPFGLNVRRYVACHWIVLNMALIFII